MQKVILLVIGFFVLSLSCDDSGSNVVWECGCEVSCDGDSIDFGTEDYCGTEEAAEDAVDDSVDECEDEMEDDDECYEWECECDCESTGESC